MTSTQLLHYQEVQSTDCPLTVNPCCCYQQGYQPIPGFRSLKASPLPGLIEKLGFRLRSPEYPGSSLIMPRLVFHVDQFTSSTLGRQQQTQYLFWGSPDNSRISLYHKLSPLKPQIWPKNQIKLAIVDTIRALFFRMLQGWSSTSHHQIPWSCLSTEDCWLDTQTHRYLKHHL